ncbi:MAG: class I SAM-dependent methyltransferase [Thermoplasmataceae archaeon]
MIEEKQRYSEEGEERFGFFGSKLYAVSALIPTFRQFHKFVINDLESFRFQSILDIGSGNGKILIGLADIRKDFVGAGIDPSPYMVKISSKKVIKKGFSSTIKFIGGSSRSLPQDEKYDMIFTSLSFHHWNEREKSIPEIMKYLNKGGRFNIYEIGNNGTIKTKFGKSHLMSTAQFKEIYNNYSFEMDLMERNGFIRASFYNE